MRIYRIDLDNYRTPGVKVFSGRDRGRAVREHQKLSIIESCGLYDQIHISVPEDVFSVTSSFLHGLVGDSIKNLGVDRFEDLYTIDPEYFRGLEDIVTWIGDPNVEKP